MEKNICLYCGIEIPEERFDSIGRRLTKSTKYCCRDHRNKHLKENNKERYKKYYQEYYKNNKEKYKKKAGLK